MSSFEITLSVSFMSQLWWVSNSSLAWMSSFRIILSVIGRWLEGGGGEVNGMHIAYTWILGLLTFLLPKDLYFTFKDGGATKSAEKLP